MGASLPPVNLQYIAAPPATGVSLLDTRILMRRLRWPGMAASCLFRLTRFI